MALNFSEWKDSHKDPEYQIEGKEPKCPEGHKWDKTLKTCVPKGDEKGNNRENPGDKALPDSLGAYNVWGSHGLNGEPPAMEVEEETIMEKPMLSTKQQRRDEENAKRHKDQDDRMRYGKKGKEFHDKTYLRPGEVKTWDKEQNRWVSNKEGK
ncbi:hypothetical protein [Synechococcus phage S-H34]|uniref:Uncharacterized protein n=1 Tax=Synechococcus phage S-H34 TaxID=2718942 RepID=A0A6G8R7B0_9CAUD|nr:hypothetical protein PQC15_gp179 [Synechococcus phage S-H34]QIN97050.1 hypothetical protein [Synechococcus phage S-H34]